MPRIFYNIPVKVAANPPEMEVHAHTTMSSVWTVMPAESSSLLSWPDRVGTVGS